MNNLEALRATCKLICNTCYVDDDVLNLSLANAGISDTAESVQNDAALVECAIVIVKGWIETSRSENGISTSINVDRVNKNIVYWCGKVGLDASDFVDDMIVMDNGSNLW